MSGDVNLSLLTVMYRPCERAGLCDYSSNVLYVTARVCVPAADKNRGASVSLSPYQKYCRQHKAKRKKVKIKFEDVFETGVYANETVARV